VRGHRERIDVIAEHAVGEHVAETRAGHAAEHDQIPGADPEQGMGAAENGHSGGRQQHAADGARSRRAAGDDRGEGDDETGLSAVQHRRDRGFNVREPDADQHVADSRIDHAHDRDPPELATREPLAAPGEGAAPERRGRGEQHDRKHRHDWQTIDGVLIRRVPQGENHRCGDQGDYAAPMPDYVPHVQPPPRVPVAGSTMTPLH
jgi:hypothetical protein